MKLAHPSLPQRFRVAWNLVKSLSAERSGNFDLALRRLDEASEIMPLGASARVNRAMLLLRAQRIPEAHRMFAVLRDEFKSSDDPDIRYLRHFCTHNLSLLNRSSGQWSYEAKEARQLNCRPSIKRRFPMTTVDEIDEAISVRR